MYKAFNEMIEAHAALAMTGKTVVPELPGDAFRLQCAKLLGSGELWDGIFIDNSELADIFMEVAIHAGVYPGKDFCLITTNTSEGLFTERRGEFAFYCQQGHVMGNAAWRMFAGMFAGSQGDELVKIPYKRQLVNNQGIINLRKSIQ